MSHDAEWWASSQKETPEEKVFKPEPDRRVKPEPPKKKPATERQIKKTWWDK
ncbi:MAG: hypothetical protein V1742_08000 [Pseudomonadota bacterium]